eukprot:233285-Hanusia_phi.AAC.2
MNNRNAYFRLCCNRNGRLRHPVPLSLSISNSAHGSTLASVASELGLELLSSSNKSRGKTRDFRVWPRPKPEVLTRWASGRSSGSPGPAR